MIIDLNDMLMALSYALDCVEHDVIGVTTDHGKRVAYISTLMGKQMGMSQQELITLAGLAIMHDNALTEFLHAELEKPVRNNIDSSLLVKHCIMGERNISRMPFAGEHKNVILYHHEHANGSGPFGKMESETPLGAQLIHIADQLDAMWKLGDIDEARFEEAMAWIRKRRGMIFSTQCTDCMLDALDYSRIQLMQGAQLNEVLHEMLPAFPRDYDEVDVKGIASLFANITDYKSKFTRTHSLGIAQKAEQMGRYYGYDEEKVEKLYFAGALHDIGKLAVNRDILEKPDKLTEQEYKHIQNHAYYTYEILRDIDGLEDVTKWASYHHEKLDGSGYPFGLTADQLNREERLLACLDIYQALTEDRPYKAGFTHEKTIEILGSMVERGQLDGAIVQDLDRVFAPGA